MSDKSDREKIESVKSGCVGAGEEGIVSCHGCFVAWFLYVTHNQIHQVVQ